MQRADARDSTIQQRLGHRSLVSTGQYLAGLDSDTNPYAGTITAWFSSETYTEARMHAVRAVSDWGGGGWYDPPPHASWMIRASTVETEETVHCSECCGAMVMTAPVSFRVREREKGDDFQSPLALAYHAVQGVPHGVNDHNDTRRPPQKFLIGVPVERLEPACMPANPEQRERETANEGRPTSVHIGQAMLDVRPQDDHTRRKSYHLTRNRKREMRSIAMSVVWFHIPPFTRWIDATNDGRMIPQGDHARHHVRSLVGSVRFRADGVSATSTHDTIHPHDSTAETASGAQNDISLRPIRHHGVHAKCAHLVSGCLLLNVTNGRSGRYN